MKILFVCSGKRNSEPGQVVKNQADSLRKAGLSLQFFIIKKKGIFGYLKSIHSLKSFLRNNHFDIVHSHYSFSGMVAGLAGARPLVVSLMGSDVYQNAFWSAIIKFFYKYKWNVTIVKTCHMRAALKIKNLIVLPNGVDFELFKIMDKEEARKKAGFSNDKKYILFVADPQRHEKNVLLAKRAIEELGADNIEFFIVSNSPNEMIPVYMNAADVLLLTSLWEGSSNVVKEAMACNLPIVSTDVGDVRQIIDFTDGCFITSFDYKDVAVKINYAISYGGRTKGRERLVLLGMDSESVADKMIDIYRNLLDDKSEKNFLSLNYR